MNASRVLQPAVLVLVLLAVSAYSLADANLGLWVLAVPGAIAAWWLTRGRPPRTMPRPLINSMLLAAAGWAVLRVTRDRFEVEVFSEFVTLITAIKLLDRRTARDDAQVLTLCAFLAVGAMLTSNSFGVGAILVVFLPCLMFTVVLQQIDAAARRAPGDRFGSSAGSRPGGGRPLLGRDVRRLVSFGWAGAMAVSVGAFVLMPRSLGTSAFGQWGNASVGSVVGFNDEITLGTGGLISQSAEPVMDVRVLDNEGRNAGAPLRAFYLRGAVLDSYRNGRWVRDRGVRHPDNERGPVPHGSASPILIGGTPGDWTHEVRVTMRQASRSGTHLFTMWRPERLRMHTPIQTLYHDLDDGSMVVAGQEGKVEYTIWSDDLLDAAPPESGESVSGPPVLPVASERVTELAREILAGSEISADPDERSPAENVAAARLFEAYFTRERFSYDLNERVAPRDQDPTEYFLFTTQTGHCEYFASAMTAMARAVGLPSRVVTGYVATDFNETTGYYLVRASNAHAWVEVQVAAGRWRVFDPTPAEDFGRLHEQRDAGLLATLRRAFETVEFAWIRAVVGFDDAARERLLGDSIPSGRDLAESAERLLDRVQAGGIDLVGRAAGRAAITFAAVFATGTVLSMAFAYRSAWWAWVLGLVPAWGRRGGDEGLPDSVVLARARAALRRAFRRLGVPRPGWRPLVEHAGSAAVVSAAGAEFGPTIDRVARAVYRVRFGRAHLDAATREVLERDVAELRRVPRRPRRSGRGGAVEEGR